MEKNANLLTVSRNCAQFPDTRNTRQTCVAPTTVWASVPTVPGVTSCTPWTRWGTPRPSLRQRRRPAVLWSSSRCLAEQTPVPLVTPLTFLTLITPPTKQTCAQQWRSSTNISTSITATVASLLHLMTLPAVALSVQTLSRSLHLLRPGNLSATPLLTQLTTWDCQSSADLLDVSAWKLNTRFKMSSWHYNVLVQSKWVEEREAAAKWGLKPPAFNRIFGEILPYFLRGADWANNHERSTCDKSPFPWHLNTFLPLYLIPCPNLTLPPSYFYIFIIDRLFISE